MAAPVHAVVNHSSPAEYAAAVTPSNTTDLDKTTRALYIGGDGNVEVDMPDGATVVFVGALGGTILPLRVNRVRAANTTATDIIALF